MKCTNKLTALSIRRALPPGRYGDGNGLCLQVTNAGVRSWLFRYMIAGHARQMGLGPLHAVSLAEARERAREARKTILAGLDPIEARRSHRAAAAAEVAGRIVFRTAAETYIAAHQSSWRNKVHAAQWPSSLARYVYPVVGDMAVTVIDTAAVMKVLEPIWHVKPETASRVRGRIESILDWAAARGYRSSENPARWRGHLAKIFPVPEKVKRPKHHAAMPYSDLPVFMRHLRLREGMSSRALEFTILTAARTGETIGAKWSEIDLDRKMWIVPGERMKMGEEHRVALSGSAIALLKSLPCETRFVFPGAKPDMPLSNMAMLSLLKAMRHPDLTVHGFRSTFRDWAGDMTEFPSETAELALAHKVGDKVEAAYRRGDGFDKRRALAETWANYCDGKGLRSS